MTKEEKLLFGERLRKLRIDKYFTQEETAEKLSISLRYYQMLERGENVGSIDLVIAISEIMDCSLDYLLRGKLQESPSNAFAVKFNRLSPQQRGYAGMLLDIWMESLDLAKREQETDAC